MLSIVFEWGYWIERRHCGLEEVLHVKYGYRGRVAMFMCFTESYCRVLNLVIVGQILYEIHESNTTYFVNYDQTHVTPNHGT